MKFDPASDPDVIAALEAAIAAEVPREKIDRELVEAAEGPNDELTPIILAGRLFNLARAARLAATR